ncbi:MAG: hypothetical protein UY50_C0018G0008 [Parcubacteria group bacterium GW2011_GWA2_49_9]|nr:MAG: hypothetical protein UY50_C0018G0008 [Parcubacteria group bacterium GW2011_GWA2_49_9]
MDNITLIGTAGATIILILFLLNQTGRIKAGALSYDAWNFLGASLLVAYSLALRAYPFAVLNAVWALFSFKDALNDVLSRKGR